MSFFPLVVLFFLYTSPSFVVYKSVDAITVDTLTIIITIATTTPPPVPAAAKRKRCVSVPLKNVAHSLC